MKKGTAAIILVLFVVLAAVAAVVITVSSSRPAGIPETTEKITEKITDKVTEGTKAAPETIPLIIGDETEPEVTDEKTTDAPGTSPSATEAPETEPKITETEKPETTAGVTDKPADTTHGVTTKNVEPLDPDKKYVALTFDDGPHPTNSKLITDKLLEYNAKATFFVIGDLIYGEREKGMQYAYQNGMQIAIHCWSHDHYYTKEPEYYHEEVYKTADKIYESIGEWPTIMRPPGGNITDEQVAASEFPVIIWSVDSNDWRYKKNTAEIPKAKNVETIVNNVLYDAKGNMKVKNGDIILMHEIYENSYDAFCIIIDKLAEEGFEFVTVSELLQNPATGYKYYSTYKIR